MSVNREMFLSSIVQVKNGKPSIKQTNLKSDARENKWCNYQLACLHNDL